MKTREDVFEKIKETLIELFEIPEEDITLEARLYQELDLDSIDAVDMIVKLQEIVDRKINPEEFKAIRTVEHIVAITYKILQETK
ncbi:MAG: acyl carrier protein [Planctomycetota bacterium]|nr:MAG: acyl carrier protein [Planctomycetota bacterium]